MFLNPFLLDLIKKYCLKKRKTLSNFFRWYYYNDKLQGRGRVDCLRLDGRRAKITFC